MESFEHSVLSEISGLKHPGYQPLLSCADLTVARHGSLHAQICVVQNIIAGREQNYFPSSMTL